MRRASMYALSIVSIPRRMNNNITTSIISSSIPASASTAARASRHAHPRPFMRHPLSPTNLGTSSRSMPISMGNESDKIRGVITHCREGLAGSEALSNTAVQRLLVQKRRRTSAIKQNTQRTERSCFKHRRGKGECQRTTHAVSPFGIPRFLRTPRCLISALFSLTKTL